MAAASVTWSMEDADQCGGSGSASVDAATGGLIVSACIPVSAGDTYTFGARVNQPAGAISLAVCDLHLFSGIACEVEDLPETFANAPSMTGWQPIQKSLELPPGTRSAIFACGPSGTGGSGKFFIDQMFFTLAPGTF